MPDEPAALYGAMYHKNMEMAELLIDAGGTFGTTCWYSEYQLKTIENYKKYITPLYDRALKCLDSVIPEKGIKKLIFDYTVPYMEPPLVIPSEQSPSVEDGRALQP